MKILNAYPGIGGNRKLWDGEKHDIVAVEINPEIAEVYRDHFPQDTVIETDAHEFIKENFEEFDFIWSSPPCPTHSDIYRMGVDIGQNQPVYPDMELYEEIIFLRTYFEGDYVVENVESYYEPLIKPQKVQRHYFWSNFVIPEITLSKDNVKGGKIREWEERFGFDLSDYTFSSVQKRKVLRNCVHPKLGKAILEARNRRQVSLKEATI